MVYIFGGDKEWALPIKNKKRSIMKDVKKSHTGAPFNGDTKTTIIAGLVIALISMIVEAIISCDDKR